LALLINNIIGLVVEFDVAIVETRVQFPDNVLF
jgi:hypothetical protein